MTEPPFLIHSLSLTAFRAFLHAKTFDLSKKRCLAIFAPNARGKSSVIDALEFMFSEEGTLERLGIRTINNQAGIVALAHNLADEAKLTPSVSIEFANGKDTSTGTRPAAGAQRPMPAITASVKKCLTVNPIIRGHALRAFVETHTPEQRYADVANWLQLGSLVDVQKNLRALRSQTKAASEDNSATHRIAGQLAKETDRVVLSWDENKIVEYAHDAVLAPLDAKLRLNTLSDSDAAYAELTNRAKEEEQHVGLAGLRLLTQAAEALWSETKDKNSGSTVTIGAIVTFESAASELAKARQAERDERAKAAGAAFQSFWKAAEPFFAEGAVAPKSCPVCDTPLEKTSAGSVEGIRRHVAAHLAELAEYAAAKRRFDTAAAAAATAHTRLTAALSALGGLLEDAEVVLKCELATYRSGADGWSDGAPPPSDALIAAVRTLLAVLTRKIEEIETRQGEHTYRKAKAKIDRLLELQAERDLALRIQAELEELSNSLTAQAAIVSREIHQKIQTLLDTLQTPMSDIYKLIQGTDAAPIRLDLPNEDDVNLQRLNLVVDFAKNRKGVQPGGYLSDSQIHSVALALRLAAIKQFNSAAPFIALDDIVTSYDADHRRTIVGMVAAMFGNYQILITTHDMRFFLYLKDQLEEKNWHYTQITRLDADYGPRFSDHKITDQMIEARWTGGESAANEMRQAEEEWLLAICRDFGVDVRIRSVERAHSYERSELAISLATFLKGAKLEPQPVPGVNNRFLTSLQRGEVENFGSHFQDGPYGDGSNGDERARWGEFKAFCSQFACAKCSRTRFQRPPTLRRPICANRDCETQFVFAAAQVGGA